MRLVNPLREVPAGNFDAPLYLKVRIGSMWIATPSQQRPCPPSPIARPLAHSPASLNAAPSSLAPCFEQEGWR